MLIFFQIWASKYAYPYAYFCGIFTKFLRLRRNESCTLFCQGGLIASVYFWTKFEAQWCFEKTRTCFWSSQINVWSFLLKKIFFNLSLCNMLINLSNMLIFFSKRASGMLINDMLIEKKHVVRNVPIS